MNKPNKSIEARFWDIIYLDICKDVNGEIRDLVSLKIDVDVWEDVYIHVNRGVYQSVFFPLQREILSEIQELNNQRSSNKHGR